MNTNLLYGTLFFVGLVAVFWILSIVLVMKKDKCPAWVNRGLYISGIMAAILNAFRMAIVYKDNKGTMVFANVVVILCLAAAFLRMEKGNMEKEDSDPKR